MAPCVQIRDVPEPVHWTLSEYLRGELVRLASRPTPEELAAQLASREPVERHESAAETIRRVRDSGV